MQATPQIYVACLASDNAGTLHGAWIDCIDADDIRQGIADMLAASPVPGAEEWEIQDTEYLPRGAEKLNIDQLAELGQALMEHGDAMLAWWENFGHCADPDLSGFEDAYRGEFRDVAEYAMHLADDCHEIPTGWPFNCIDWDHAGRELEIGGDIWTAENPAGGIFVFANI